MFMEIASSLIVFVLALFMLGCLAANWSVAIRWIRYKKRGSLIPFVGGIAGCIALAVNPWFGSAWLWFIPFVLDPSYWLWIVPLLRNRSS